MRLRALSGVAVLLAAVVIVRAQTPSPMFPDARATDPVAGSRSPPAWTARVSNFTNGSRERGRGP